MQSPSPLVVVVGETASGKSALALALAEHFGAELICADSWTVYRGFDIGTAKPSATEQATVPHHLLDIADPVDGFSAVEFQKAAFKVIDDIHNRSKLPIMVGGTGLYIDSVVYNYQFLPAPPEGVRDLLNALSLEELQHRAAAEGLDTTGIDMRNKRRIIRLIENAGVRPSRHDLRPATLLVGIQRDREHLRERIEQRVDAMLAAGLEAEVRQLAEQYGWQAEPMKGIGYREFEAQINGTQTAEQTRERIIAATLGLAKRQRTWFKRNDDIHWLEPDNSTQQAVELIADFLQASK